MKPSPSVREHQLVEPQASAERFWMTTREVMDLIAAPTMKATYCWLHRRGIVRNGYGRVSRFDVQRALKVRSRRGRHPNTLANLSRRSA